MKILVLDPDFGKSALLMDNKRRVWNYCIVIKKMLEIFDTQKNNDFESVPNYRMWQPYQDAMKVCFNAYLQVCKEIHHFNSKYQYYTDFPDNIKYPLLTDITFKSHQAFLLELDSELYTPKFGDSKGFNGGKLIWEYLKGDTLICEDFNGIKKAEDILLQYPNLKTDYNMKELNYKYTQLKN